MVKRIAKEEEIKIEEKYDANPDESLFVTFGDLGNGNKIEVQFTVSGNSTIRMTFIPLGLEIPRENVYDVLKLFSYLNLFQTYSKLLLDFDSNREVMCIVPYSVGREVNSIPKDKYDEIKAVFMTLFKHGLTVMTEIRPFVDAIVSDEADVETVVNHFCHIHGIKS